MRALTVAVVAAIALATPALLVVNGLRLVAHDWVVRFEYGREGFPEDRYGLTRAERTELALVGLDAIRPGTQGVELLRRARLPDGSAAFGPREIAHMQDVRDVFARLRLGHLVGLVVLLAAALALRRTALRTAVPTGLLAGALLTLGAALAAVPVILLGFEGFFAELHGLFFEGDTWRFPSSDTLIRLYPDRFWEDVAQLVAGLTLAQALLLAGGAWLWRRRALRVPGAAA